MEFEQLYAKHFKEIHLFIRSLCNDDYLAEEITQETFYKVLKSIDQFDGSKDIKAWIYTIAKNTYFTHYKKKKKEVDVDLTNNLIHEVNFLQKLSNEEDAFLVHQFLHQLNEPYKEVFSLRTFGELPYENIGRLFGKSSSWARVTFYRAKKQIINYMGGIDNERE
ncbi:RNA polymerase sigma factor [Alkalicoccobacillus porphyridii]|uniref:Sigma-70 family RNA polymerase sigma factor n=1 Tax=Alkalicoccobacillus porphyridii TaxID=2597270 RepID=A0A553ZWN9_9BACI|nr:sigma-70 family RNA polymerase sigma factor [Alkalicoccobacillus porphyridii]TSB45874.1 sigma-70 family RNA polymerase sigma factor [Alkalicoccobacillus porphyridii]